MKYPPKINNYPGMTIDEYNRYACWVVVSWKNTKTNEILEDEPIYYPDCIIYSVKRTTDGEVFTIGDELMMVWDDKLFLTIKSFKGNHIQMRVDEERGGIPFTDDFKHWIK